MNKDRKNIQLHLAYELMQTMHDEKFEYIYRGLFTDEIIAYILNLTQENLLDNDQPIHVRNRLFYVIVECLQNMTRHQDKPIDDKFKKTGIFSIQKQENEIYTTTANIVKKEKILKLKEQIEKIKKLNPKELKKYYQDILSTGNFSEKGGAGLGLIAVARKAEQLLFDFKELNPEDSYFYFRTEIQLSDKKNETITENSLEKTKKIHNILNQENILLNFTGAFNQKNLDKLLPIVEIQMNTNYTIKQKVIKIVFRMLQNIVKYSKDFSKHKHHNGSPGIFLLSQKSTDFILTAGNYLEKEKAIILQDKIKNINSLEKKELSKLQEQLIELNDADKPDLSLIEIRIQGNSKLIYDFKNINDEFTFFTLQVIV